MAFRGDWRLGLGAVIVAGSLIGCTNQAQLGVSGAVEPEARAAFDRALARYPEPVRSHLAEVRLARESDYGVPADAPLMARLMGHAAYAYYSMNQDAVILLDAGLAERARWAAGDANLEAVGGLMRDLDLMGEGVGVWPAWERFVESVQGWPGEPPIAGAIRLGDERVLDRFVHLGVGRALAREGETLGSLDLEQQMIHELAHALQLGGPLMLASARMEAWGTLSGWVRVDRNEPFDGFHGGIVMLEQPRVLGCLLLHDERGEGLFAPAPGARFVNRYARYDAREDYAESVRLFVEDPERLIRIDPVKFMFINAMGYNASLRLDEPGPLWISEAQIQARGWQEHVQRGATELLRGREGITVDPRTVAGLLRAHAGVLHAEGLPECEVFDRPPTDAPDSIAKALNPDHFSVVIDGERFGPSSQEVEALLLGAITDWFDDDAFWRAMNQLVESDAQSMEEEYADLAEIDDAQKRAMGSARLIERAGLVVGETRHAEMLSREVRAMRASDQHLLAEMLKLRFGISRNGSISEDLLEYWHRIAAEAGGEYGAIELQRGLVDLYLQRGDPERAVQIANEIGGESWGLLRKVEALCAVARHADDSAVLVAVASELAARKPTMLTEYLTHMIDETLAVMDGLQEVGE